MDAVEAGFGDTAEQARDESTGCGLLHRGVLVPESQYQHGRGRPEAGEVPYAHGALDEVVAKTASIGGGEVEQHQSVQRPVEPERHEERVDHRDQDGEDDGGVPVQPGQAATDTGAGPDADGTEQEGCERDHDDHGEERHEDHLNVLREDLFPEAVHQGQHRSHDQRHEDLSTVVVELQR